MKSWWSGAALAAAACLFVQPALADEPKLTAAGLAQIQAVRAEKQARTATQKKIQSRLLFSIYKQRNDARIAALPDLRIAAPLKDGRMLVDFDVASAKAVKTVVNAVERAGGLVTTASLRFGAVRAFVPLNRIEGLAALASVRRVQLAREAMTHKLNTSEGDVAHQADLARPHFGVDGAGQKICVLSDGVNSLASLQGSGDLPAVDVLPGQAGDGDEGTAMLEIVHDLAPGAALGFASAFESEEQFAQNILDLGAAGCTVIVDDVIYFDEPVFQDGLVASSVAAVTAGGVEYFSSAGNEGNKNDDTSGAWEGKFTGNGTPGALAGAGPVNNFGDGGQSILVTGDGARVVLHWADPQGTSSNDYDIYDMDGGLTTLFDLSVGVQDGVGGDDFPVEISGPAFAGERIVVAKFDGQDRVLNLLLFRGTLDSSLSTAGATRGHSAVEGAYSVAAVDATLAAGGGGSFDGSEPVELFSSDGPRLVYYLADGTPIPGSDPTNPALGLVRAKPDVAAADGVATAAPGFTPFYGTSAAAPHAAAIAALVKQAVPGIDAASLRSTLTSTALDIEASGSDRDSGAGIVMPYPALTALGLPAAANPVLVSATPSEVTGDGDADIEPGETFSVALAVQNTGAAAATSVSVALATGTPGVTILQSTSAYPDLAVGATETNSAALTFKLGTGAACGQSIAFAVTLTFAGGNGPVSFPVRLATGGFGTAATFSFTGPATAIPDGLDVEVPGPVQSVGLAVSGLARLKDLDFRIDGTTCSTAAGSTTVGLDHTYVGDLVLRLRAPSGTTIPLVSRLAGGGGGYGGNNFCQTLLDDESAGPSIQGVQAAPFTGSFKAAGPLSAFDGEDPNGSWSLEAIDHFAADEGSVRAFSLIATPAVCQVFQGGGGGSYVTVTAPDAVTTWQAGATKPIKFIHNLGKNKPVAIEINRDYPGGSWVTLASPVLTTSASGGTYNWLVSGVTPNARFRVTSLDTGAQDVSNASIVISNRVKVTAPNSATSWKVGTVKAIKWTHNYPAPATFELRLDNNDDGVCETLIKASVSAPASPASYSWTVAGAGAANRVCVRKIPADPDGADVSDVVFKIIP